MEVKTREFVGTHLEAVAFVWSMNRTRRHLNSGQAAIAEVKRAAFVEEYAAEIEKMRGEAKERKKRKSVDSVPQQVTEQNSTDRETSTTLARAAGTNRRYLEAAAKLLESAPEKLPAIPAALAASAA